MLLKNPQITINCSNHKQQVRINRMTSTQNWFLLILSRQQIPNIHQQRMITLLRLLQQHLSKSPTHRPSRLSLHQLWQKKEYLFHGISGSLIILASRELDYVRRGSFSLSGTLFCFSSGCEFLEEGGSGVDDAWHIAFRIGSEGAKETLTCLCQEIRFLQWSLVALRSVPSKRDIRIHTANLVRSQNDNSQKWRWVDIRAVTI